jgi:hypothetical protein
MILVPKDSVVEIVSGLENRHRMIPVEWEGIIVMLFTQDVRERGEVLEKAAAAVADGISRL